VPRFGLAITDRELTVLDFTRASALAGFSELAQRKGLDPSALLSSAGLPDSILEQPDGLIRYANFLRLLQLSAEQSGDSAFGLKLGLQQGLSVFGPLLYLIRNAPTVGSALQELQQNFHLHMGAAAVELERYGDLVQLSYHIFDSSRQGIVQGVELAIGVGVQLLTAICGQHWQLQAALFEHSPHAELTTYRRLLGVSPQFNSNANALVFHSRLLDLPLSEADQELQVLIRHHLATLDRLTDPELPDYVSALLRNMLDRGRVTVDDVAVYMAMSRRTLQRRLAACGTTFQEVLDRTRKNMALRYLRDSSLQMTQLADLLGYGDLSAFSRAFSRWFGMAPTQWQAQEQVPQ